MRDSAGSAAPGLPDPAEAPASDELLLAAVRAGDSAAFGELFERHRGAALAVARMHSRNEADAQDLVSEAFTRVLGLLREGRGPREFLRAYLVTAVSRLAADRANDLSRTRPEEPRPDGPLDQVQLFDDTVVRQVDSAVVARAFASLPERWQEVLWYLEVEGRRPRQVATVVGVQPNAVSALGKRAREGLRTAYMQEHVSAQALEDCHRYSSQLGAFARGSLTPSRTKMVQDHLGECPRCTAEYLQLQDLGLGMRGWLLPVFAGLPLWEGAGGRLAEALAGLPLGGGGTAAGAAVVSAGAHDAAGAAASRTAASGTGAAAGGAGVPAGAPGKLAGLAGPGAGLAAGLVALAVVAASAVGFVALHDPSTAPEPAAVSTEDARDGGGAASADPSGGAAATSGTRRDDARDLGADGTPAPGSGGAGTEGSGSGSSGSEEGAGAGGADEHPEGAGAPRDGAALPAPFLPDAPPAGTLPRTLPTPAASLPVALPTESAPPDVVVPDPGSTPGGSGGATDATPAPSGGPGEPTPQPTPDPSVDPCDWILPWCPPWEP